MRAVWDAGPSDVEAVHRAVSRTRELKEATVRTVLDIGGGDVISQPHLIGLAQPHQLLHSVPPSSDDVAATTV